MPTDLVRGLKAHGSSPAKTKADVAIFHFLPAQNFPGTPLPWASPKTPEEPRKPVLLRCRVYRRLLVHHVIAAQELAGCGMGAFALLKRNRPIDDGIADAFGLLDQATLASREVGGIDRVVV